jgi:hypothetical protein
MNRLLTRSRTRLAYERAAPQGGFIDIPLNDFVLRGAGPSRLHLMDGPAFLPAKTKIAALVSHTRHHQRTVVMIYSINALPAIRFPPPAMLLHPSYQASAI